MAIAGHVSRKMLEHYSHIRMEAKRTALDAIAATLNPTLGSTTNLGSTQMEAAHAASTPDTFN
jgi:hypothetical protein